MSVPIYNENREIERHYEGRVIREWEKNGYHDSDWYVLVMEDDGTFNSFCYSTTRGGSAPASADVDATDEVLAAYAEHQAARERVGRIRRLRCVIREAATTGLTARQWIDVRHAVSPRHHLHHPAPTSRYTPSAASMLTWADPVVENILNSLGKLKRDSFRSDFQRSLATQVFTWATSCERKHPTPLSPKQLGYIQ